MPTIITAHIVCACQGSRATRKKCATRRTRGLVLSPVSLGGSSYFLWKRCAVFQQMKNNFYLPCQFFENQRSMRMLLFLRMIDLTEHFIVKKNKSYVSVKSSFNMPPPPPPEQPPGHLTFLKIIVQIPPYPGQNAVQMPHTRVHSGDQMPPPRGHFTGTKMTEGQRKRLQLSNKIFINITKTEQHCWRIYYEQKSRAKRRKSLLPGH